VCRVIIGDPLDVGFSAYFKDPEGDLTEHEVSAPA
jgi:hypothetical protein